MNNADTDNLQDSASSLPKSDVADPHSDENRDDVKITIIQPRPGWHLINGRELWAFRELLFFFALRDIKVRYKQTVLGIFWVVLPPIATMLIFTVIFGKIAKVPTGDVPYPIFVYAGILPWQLFTAAFGGSVASVVSATPIISKVYVPRLLLPFSRVATTIVDFLVKVSVLVALMLYYDYLPGWRLLYVPVLVLLTAMAALGLGTFFAALNVSFRDISKLQKFIIQFGLFLTPAIFMDVHNTVAEPSPANESVAATPQSTSADTGKGANRTPGSDAKQETDEHAVPDELQHLLELNPLMGIISAFRAAILNRPLPWPQLSYAVVVTTILFVAGCLFFEKAQRNFADII